MSEGREGKKGRKLREGERDASEVGLNTPT
jgi:hypothetical protein